MLRKHLKKHDEKIRFAIVGVINTSIDFSVLFILYGFGVHSIIGNFFSTSAALIFSFFANKKYTFKHEGKNTNKQIAAFLIITLIGLWIIQPIIIELAKLLLSRWFGDSYLVLFIGKGFATAASLVWNYILYKKFVFKKRS